MRAADRVRSFIERHLPWYNPDESHQVPAESKVLEVDSRRVRTQATRTMRARDGYRAYGRRATR